MTTSQTAPARAARIGDNSRAAARPLRTFLILDAIVTGANGLIYLLAAGPVGDLLDVSTGVLRGIGAFLTVFGLVVALVARRPVPSTVATKVIIEANLLWTVASVATAIFAWLGTNTLGTVWTVMQAAVVGLFAVLQITGLKKLAN
ncbi:hypothetical protein ACIRP0_30365 [Streptomyces sp. NPDC101733]|uniref:hypothetical protein n=1 Tax=unclassified Streptomyces TaxID=2593676 RepID=UPI003812E296